MKLKLHFIFMFAVCLFFSCSDVESIAEEAEQNYFEVTEYTVNNTSSSRVVEETPCFTLDLIAGQHMTMGSISISQTDTDLILTYLTDVDWTIGVTHVSIGDCDEEWVPLTGSGNPKIGKFGHTEPHSQDINKVIYKISLETLPEDKDYYCFAAHAEVIGPDGEETAWAGDDGSDDSSDDNDDDDDDDGDDGSGGVFRVNNAEYEVKEFQGRSWATYVEAQKSACD